MASKITPLGTRVLVKRIEPAEQKSEGGIFLPDTAKEKPQEAEVLALGNGKNDEGEIIEFSVKVGDKVLISKYGGNRSEDRRRGVRHRERKRHSRRPLLKTGAGLVQDKPLSEHSIKPTSRIQISWPNNSPSMKKRVTPSSRCPQARESVKATLGPAGRNVILDKKFGSPTITKDGVTVAKEIELTCPYENMGAQLIKEVSSKTSDIAGDGTTTATVLAEAIFSEGLRNVTAGANPISLQRGIMKAANALVASSRRSPPRSPTPRRSRRSRPSPPTGTPRSQHHRRRDGQGRQGRNHHG